MFITKTNRVNYEIQANEVRVINNEGKQIGIMSLHKALKLAREQALDLVEVSSATDFPVCKIMDYGKYRYEQKKKERKNREKQKVIQIKEIKLRPQIEEHDYQVKTRQIRKFIESGNKVKIIMTFRGREILHVEFGEKILNKLIEDLKTIAAIERPSKLEGKHLILVLTPIKKKGLDSQRDSSSGN